MDGHRVLRRDLSAARLRNLGAVHRPHADLRLHPARCALLSRHCLRHRGRDRDPARAFPVWSGHAQDLSLGDPASVTTTTASEVLSRIVTPVALLAFLVALQDPLTLRRGA